MGFFTDAPNYSDIEIGWRFKQASWGHGYATEAALALCDELIKQDDVKAISATALKDNTASIKIMKKLGLQFIKTIHIQMSKAAYLQCFIQKVFKDD